MTRRAIAGAASRRSVVPWLAGSLLAHAVFAALLEERTQRAEPTRPIRAAAQLQVRVLPAPSVGPRGRSKGELPLGGMAGSTKDSSINPQRVSVAANAAAPARVAARRARPAQAAATVEAPRPSDTDAAAAAPPAIDGAVFGMPQIAFAAASPSRWMSRPADAARPMMVAGYAPPSAPQALTLRDAGRAQVSFALERQVSTWPPPAETLDAACDLRGHPAERLDCSSAALQQVVSLQVAALLRLLQAWRSIEPRAIGLSIGYGEGGYRVSLQFEDAPTLHARVPAEP